MVIGLVVNRDGFPIAHEVFAGNTQDRTTLATQSRHTSWAAVRNALKTHQVCTIVLPTKTGQTLRLRKASTPEKEVAQLYALLRLPDQVIKPVTRWINSQPCD